MNGGKAGEAVKLLAGSWRRVAFAAVDADRPIAEVLGSAIEGSGLRSGLGGNPSGPWYGTKMRSFRGPSALVTAVHEPVSYGTS